LQAELFASFGSYEDAKNFTEETVNGDFINSYTISESSEIKTFTAYLVPASYRYNLNNYLAVGGGAQLRFNISQKTISEAAGQYSLIIPSEGTTIRDETQDTFVKTESDCDCYTMNTGVFAGFNVGAARIGPSVGARYIYYFGEEHQQIQLYGIWKF